MEYVIAGLVLLGFGYFIYKKVTAPKTPSTGTGGGGSKGGSVNTQEK
jgi:hypothetical protein